MADSRSRLPSVKAARVERTAALRAAPLLKALHALGAYVKEDDSFQPTRNKDSRRFHVNAAGREFELVMTGQKWFDTRASKGGGGPIDLTMHVYSETFIRAFGRLERALGDGGV